MGIADTAVRSTSAEVKETMENFIVVYARELSFGERRSEKDLLIIMNGGEKAKGAKVIWPALQTQSIST